MQVKAQAKALRSSPRKLGLVAGLVRGTSVEEAMTILEHTPRRAAGMLREVIKAAQANAEHNFSLDPKQLDIKTILVNPGFRLKRYRAGSRGMARPITHRSSSVTVIVEDKPKKTEPRGKALASSAARRKGKA